MKAVSPDTMTKVFKRNKTLAWLVESVWIVKVEEANQLTHYCTMFTQAFS